MGCPCEILVDSVDKGLAEPIVVAVRNEAWRIEQKWSRYLHPDFALDIGSWPVLETTNATLMFGAGGQNLTSPGEVGGILEYGVSERGGFSVIQKPMLQWSLRITAYAQRLLDGLTNLDWPSSLIAQQQNWIGRSQGAQVFFDLKAHLDPVCSKGENI